MELYIFWTICALISFILELFIPGSFAFLFVGVSCLFTSLICALYEMSWGHSSIIFAFLTIILLVGFRNKYASRWKIENKTDLNNSLEKLMHTTGQIVAIDNHLLKVKIGNYFWSAQKKSPELEITINSTVRVVGYKQMTLLVEPVASSSSSPNQK